MNFSLGKLYCSPVKWNCISQRCTTWLITFSSEDVFFLHLVIIQDVSGRIIYIWQDLKYDSLWLESLCFWRVNMQHRMKPMLFDIKLIENVSQREKHVQMWLKLTLRPTLEYNIPILFFWFTILLWEMNSEENMSGFCFENFILNLE